MYGLCRYLDWVTLTYISCSIDFYTFYVTLPYVLNCKAFNHQTLYSTSSRCTDSTGTLPWWPWPILCTPVTLTHFILMFGFSSNIRPTTTKPCIVLHLIALAWQVSWPSDLDLYFMLQWLLHILHQRSIIIGLYDTKSQCWRYSH